MIVTKEKHVPYDRTKLSKAMQLDGAKLALRPEEYYKVKFHLVVLDQCDVLKLVFTG